MTIFVDDPVKDGVAGTRSLAVETSLAGIEPTSS